MSMSAIQISAFQAAAGYQPTAGQILFLGLTMTLVLLWSAWALWSLYRGWANQTLSGAIAGKFAIHLLVLVGAVSIFVFS